MKGRCGLELPVFGLWLFPFISKILTIWKNLQIRVSFPAKQEIPPKSSLLNFVAGSRRKALQMHSFIWIPTNTRIFLAKKFTFAADQIKRIPNDFQNPCFLLSPLIWLWNVFWWEGCGRSRNSVAHSARVRAGWSIIGQPGVERIWSEETFKKIMISIMMIMIITMAIMWVINYRPTWWWEDLIKGDLKS